MILVALYNQLNCALDKTIDAGHTANINCHINYSIKTNYSLKLLMMLFITSWSKPLKTEPSREICTYATRVKHF